MGILVNLTLIGAFCLHCLSFQSIQRKNNKDSPTRCPYYSEVIFYIYFADSVKVTQLCPTLCDPMDYTVHRILQARILEWVAFPFSRGSSQPKDRTQVSRMAGRFFIS